MQQNSGFTLIELLVSVTLASILTVALLGAFVSFLQYQVVAQEERNALETARFLLADVSRDLQFGYDYTCDPPMGTCTCITFSDQLGRRVKVRHNRGYAEKSVKYLDPNPDDCLNTDSWTPLTDDSLTLIDFVFELEDQQNRQPRVKLRAVGKYESDGETRDLEVKTQVTRRILEPTQAVASGFRIGIDIVGPGTTTYFAFGPEPNPCYNSSDSNCGVDQVGANCTVSNSHLYLKPEKMNGDCGDSTSSESKANQVCRDDSGNVYPEDPSTGVTLCGASVIPLAAEFTTDGLYVLGDNGLIFLIKQNAIDLALTVTDGATPVFVSKDDIQGRTIKRVLGASGSGTCRFCGNDPRDIIAITAGKDILYARGTNGSLYTVTVNASGEPVAERLLEGGITSGTVKYLSVGGKRVLILFRGNNGGRVLRLFTRTSETGGIGAGDLSSGTCPEFQHVPSVAGCRQLWPDATDDGSDIEPELLKTTLDSIPLSFIDHAQVIDDTVLLWYRDAAGGHLLSVTDSGEGEQRSGDVAESSSVTRGNGYSPYTFICNGGTDLCEVADIAGGGTVKQVRADGGSMKDHLHFEGHPVGISGRDRLLYFSDSDIADNDEVIVYDHSISSPRVLCRTVPRKQQDGPFQQVSFTYLSEAHPSSAKDIVAAIGRSTKTGEQGEEVYEVYLLEPQRADKVPYTGTKIDTVCGDTEYVERHRLPSGVGPALDLVRLTGVAFIDTDS